MALHSTVSSAGTPAMVGGVLSVLEMRCVPVAVLPQLSVAVHVLTKT